MVDTASPWAGRTVVVTGATGFIGVHLVDALLAHGAHVVGLSRRPQPPHSAANMHWLQVDPVDLDALTTALQSCRPDTIYHLSSLANGKPDLALVVPILHAEVVATVQMLTVAAGLGVRRVILPGSLEEPAPGAAANSPYAAAKAASQTYARMFHLVYKLPVVTARIFMTYGPGQPAWKLIPSVAQALLAGTAPKVNSPSRAVDWIYVSDVVAGLLRAGAAEGIEGRSVDLGTGTLTTIRDLVELLCALSQASARPTFGVESDRVAERVIRADVATAERLLGWRPVVTLRDGLARTLNALTNR